MQETRTNLAKDARPVINEAFVLRSVACLSILLLHAVTRTVPEGQHAVDLLKLMLTFGTPTFVFISELILSFSYPASTPKSFWKGRLKYLLMPYILFGAFYALVKAVDVSMSEKTPLLLNFFQFLWRHLLLGEYHGYFILIIFQFYVLHLVFNRYVRDRLSSKLVIPAALIINLAYLAFFNFVKEPPIPFSYYIWDKLYWFPFPGWLFYFAVAYYAGRNYKAFSQALSRYGGLLLAFVVLSALGLYAMLHFNYLTVISSKRLDMVFFTTAMILALFWLSSRLKQPPRFLVWISRYSFGIYLIHPFFTAILFKMMSKWMPIDNPVINIAILSAGSLFASILVVKMLQPIPISQYVIGKIGVGTSKKTPPPAARVAVLEANQADGARP
ncbi:acyltransferase family protein [Paenibacillus thalictri]|uniref:Adhesin n=1 Tax=Paenibacillus thalictri TaxID=2527873 RepID=A0A4Q9DJ08_9BACL|nr:acyltransferase family protein [Paenibacillus thalictri]TBL70828.1 adhesin [Paenibacillus thalictri]